MVRTIVYFIYIFFTGLVIVKGVNYGERLWNEIGATFVVYPWLIFIIIYSIALGCILAMPNFTFQAQKKGKWYLNKKKLLTLGFPTLIFLISQTILFMPISNIFSELFIYLNFTRNGQIITISGIILGYILITSFGKTLENKS